MLDNCKGSLPLALAAYNAGYQRVVSCGFQIPAIKETQGFVTEVLGRYHAAQNMGTDASLKSGRLMPVAAIIPE
jgi:soluble lytic murein transglycosylase-like protein